MAIVRPRRLTRPRKFRAAMASGTTSQHWSIQKPPVLVGLVEAALRRLQVGRAMAKTGLNPKKTLRKRIARPVKRQKKICQKPKKLKTTTPQQRLLKILHMANLVRPWSVVLWEGP